MNELFSPTENAVLKIIGKRKISISKITVIFMETNKSKALHPNQIVSGAIKNINLKCKHHKLPWFINGAGIGRGGKTVWRDK